MEFHVHTYVSLLVVRAMLSHNLIRKSDQLVVYVYRLLNITKYNDSTIEKKALVLVFLAQLQTLFVG